MTRAQAELAIQAGARCCTQNPAYLSKVMTSEDDGPRIRERMDRLIAQYADDNAVVAELQRQTIADICARFEPLYEASGGREGLVSIQADPFHEDTATILDNAARCRKLCKNFIIKIPATQSGLAAMGELIRERVPVLATEVMSVDQTLDLFRVYGEAAGGLTDPAPFWFAHINGIFDEHLSEYVPRQASFILSKKLLALRREKARPDCHYVAGGARGLHHFTEMVGVEGAVTINWKGTADKLIEADLPVVDIYNDPRPRASPTNSAPRCRSSGRPTSPAP